MRQSLQDQGGETCSYDTCAAGCGMESILLTQGRADPGHQIRVQGNMFGAGDVGIDPRKVAGVTRANDGGRLQSSEQDGNSTVFQPGDDGPEVGRGYLGINTLKQVISSQGDNAQAGVRLHAEVDPGETSGGCVSRDARSPDIEAGIFTMQFCF